MEGKTHYMFAPIFTVGATYLLATSSVISTQSIPIPLAVAIAAGCSLTTSLVADADLHAYKPKYVILDSKPKKKKNGEYIVKVRVTKKDSKGNMTTSVETRKYKPPKSPQIRAWALFFKAIGITKHRDWRSHSPLLWGFIWFNIIYWIGKTPLAEISPTLNALLTIIFCGLGMGYISHIVGDMFTKGGVPLGPEIKLTKKKSIGGESVGFIKLLPKPLRGFFTAGNQLYNKLFLIAGVEVIGYLIIPEQTKAFNSIIFGMVKGLVLMLAQISGELF